MLGISTDPVSTVQEHVGIICVLTHHKLKKEDCPNSPDEEQQQGWVCLPGSCTCIESLAWTQALGHVARHQDADSS